MNNLSRILDSTVLAASAALATGVKTATGTNSRKGVYVKSTQGYAQAYLGSLAAHSQTAAPGGLRAVLSARLEGALP